MTFALLASILSFGWPSEKTVFVSVADDAAMQAKGYRRITLNKCCGSMLPSIRGGETAYVEDYRRGMDLFAGEIADDGRAIHRIIALSKDGVKLAGDANQRSDPWEPRDNIRYIVRVIVRK
jgi:hypothetical protein